MDRPRVTHIVVKIWPLGVKPAPLLSRCRTLACYLAFLSHSFLCKMWVMLTWWDYESESEVAQSCPNSLRPCGPSMAFSRQEYWSGLPFPSPGDLHDPGIKPKDWTRVSRIGGRRFNLWATREVSEHQEMTQPSSLLNIQCLLSFSL